MSVIYSNIHQPIYVIKKVFSKHSVTSRKCITESVLSNEWHTFSELSPPNKLLFGVYIFFFNEVIKQPATGTTVEPAVTILVINCKFHVAIATVI